MRGIFQPPKVSPALTLLIRVVFLKQPSPFTTSQGSIPGFRPECGPYEVVLCP
jgi:hypothetical protein